MNTDGSNQHNITNSPADPLIANNNSGPVASPDGKYIAFVSDRDGNAEIYVIDIDSGIQTNLTNNKAVDEFPCLGHRTENTSPLKSDRDATLLDKNRDLWTNNIYIMNADGSNVHRLTIGNVTNGYGSLSWSPDGKKFAFCMLTFSPYGLNYSAGINTLTLSDFTLTRLTFDSSTDQCGPEWSPDGKKIVYLVSGSMLTNIYVMNADGTGQTNLSDNPSFFDTDPSWSPDGRYIVFSSRRDGGYHLYVMNADGTNQTQLTNGPGEETVPSWLKALAP